MPKFKPGDLVRLKNKQDCRMLIIKELTADNFNELLSPDERLFEPENGWLSTLPGVKWIVYVLNFNCSWKSKYTAYQESSLELIN